MTDQRDRPDDRRDLAAEYALGVLSGNELSEARERATSDADFALAVARWRGRLAPLGAEVEPAAPPKSVWTRIEQAVAQSPVADSNVVVLHRRIVGSAV